MSSSSTETLIDVTMPQMGVSVAEGTVVEWKKQPGDWVRGRRDHRLDLDRQDRHRRRGARPPAACRSCWSRSARPSRSAPCWRGSPPTPSRARRTAARTRLRPRRRGHERGRGRARRPRRGRRAPGRHGGGARRARPSAARAAARRSGPRRYSPVVMRIASEHGIDLDQVEGTGRGGRVRKQDVLAFIENGGGAAVEEPPMHIESPYRPDEPAPPKKRKPRFEQPAPARRRAAARRARRCRACARRSARGCWSRCRRRPPARRWSRPT